MAELFDRFEVNRVPRWPLMTRLVALSVVLHGLFFVAVAYVPTLRSLLHAAGSVAGIEFVSEDYDRTLVGQRATIVKLEPYEKLYYPSDYFGPPPGEEASPTDPMLITPTAPPAPPPMIIRPRRSRTPRVTATPEPTPEETAEAEATPSPTPSDADAELRADAELDKVAEANGVRRPPRINSRPFEDLAKKGKAMFEEGKVKLDGVVDVTATGQLKEDGSLDRDTVKIEGLAADENLTLLAQELITAISESKVLGILEGAKDVKMSLKLDQQNVSVKVMADLGSDELASRSATGYGVLLLAARAKKQGTNEGELYNRLRFGAEGKQFVMSFEMPKDAAGKMIADMLAKKAEGNGKT